MSQNGAGVVVALSDISGLHNLFYQTIIAKLGEDKDALAPDKFEVSIYEPKTVEEAKQIARMGKRLFEVKGFLKIDDSGDGRFFGFTMEEGLTDAEDREIADQLAHQCLACVAEMRREAGLSNAHIIQRVHRRGTH